MDYCNEKGLASGNKVNSISPSKQGQMTQSRVWKEVSFTVHKIALETAASFRNQGKSCI